MQAKEPTKRYGRQTFTVGGYTFRSIRNWCWEYNGNGIAILVQRYTDNRKKRFKKLPYFLWWVKRPELCHANDPWPFVVHDANEDHRDFRPHDAHLEAAKDAVKWLNKHLLTESKRSGKK